MTPPEVQEGLEQLREVRRFLEGLVKGEEPVLIEVRRTLDVAKRAERAFEGLAVRRLHDVQNQLERAQRSLSTKRKKHASALAAKTLEIEELERRNARLARQHAEVVEDLHETKTALAVAITESVAMEDAFRKLDQKNHSMISTNRKQRSRLAESEALVAAKDAEIAKLQESLASARRETLRAADAVSLWTWALVAAVGLGAIVASWAICVQFGIGHAEVVVTLTGSVVALISPLFQFMMRRRPAEAPDALHAPDVA